MPKGYHRNYRYTAEGYAEVEKQAMALIGKGVNRKQICSELGVSESWITHAFSRNGLRKMWVTAEEKAMIEAHRAGRAA